MLPADAITHFHNLCSAQMADASVAYSKLREDFERGESSRGQGPRGAGFAARLARLYADDLAKRTQIIISALKTIQEDFDLPPDEGVGEQLKDLGLRTLSQVFQGLEGGYVRHLQRIGLSAIHPSGLDQKYALHRVSVSNLISRHMWTIRRVPMKKQPDASTGQTSVTIHGPVGVVQTGAHSTANVQQIWSQAGAAKLIAELDSLRVVLIGTQELDAAAKHELAMDIEQAKAELGSQEPNKARLVRWLGGIGALVQTVASAQPALEAVRAAARAIGLPL